MTVRDKVQQQSPDGNVLLLEDIRRCLGLGADTNETVPSTEADKEPLKVILMGHDMRGDFPNMKKAGIDISQHLHYAGCGDTHVWIEDTQGPLPLGLSGLIAHYGLAQCHYTQTLRKGQKWVFIGAHNAGNDAVMTIKLALAQALDQGLGSKGGKVLDLEDPEWSDKPLHGMDAGMILLAYDTEAATNNNYATTVLNRTTEHGFAWLRLADIPYIQARHWINKDLKGHKNRDYCVGNPHGFWEQYGKSLYYTDKEGPAPFQALFEELAGGRGVDEAAAAVERLALESLTFPSLSGAASTAQMEVSGRAPLPERVSKINHINRPDADNKWTRGNPWVRVPPSKVVQGIREGSAQGGGHRLMAGTSTPDGGLVGNASTTSNGGASIATSTTTSTRTTTAASGDKAAATSKPPNAKVTSSWAQIARGR